MSTDPSDVFNSSYFRAIGNSMAFNGYTMEQNSQQPDAALQQQQRQQLPSHVDLMQSTSNYTKHTPPPSPPQSGKSSKQTTHNNSSTKKKTNIASQTQQRKNTHQKQIDTVLKTLQKKIKWLILTPCSSPPLCPQILTPPTSPIPPTQLPSDATGRPSPANSSPASKRNSTKRTMCRGRAAASSPPSSVCPRPPSKCGSRTVA